jgi:hypothetical protein
MAQPRFTLERKIGGVEYRAGLLPGTTIEEVVTRDQANGMFELNTKAALTGGISTAAL